MTLLVENPPANTADKVQSLDWEDLLQKEMATYSSILAWEIPWIEETWQGATDHGVTKYQTRLSTHTPEAFTLCLLWSKGPMKE